MSPGGGRGGGAHEGCTASGWWGRSGQALQDYAHQYNEQDRLIAEWERRIDDLVQDLPEVQTIQRELPGVGRILAPVIHAETGPLERFDSPKQLGSYTGLVPRESSSAARTRQGAISREGSAYLRWALVEAVVACLKTKQGAGRAVGDWVRRRQKRMGDKKRAHCAAARKLAETLWRLCHYGERFDATRAFSA